jgi:hypothetical protein
MASEAAGMANAQVAGNKKAIILKDSMTASAVSIISRCTSALYFFYSQNRLKNFTDFKFWYGTDRTS